MTTSCKRCHQTAPVAGTRFCKPCRHARYAALDEWCVRVLVAGVVLAATSYCCWTCQGQSGLSAAHAGVGPSAELAQRNLGR